MLFCDALRDDVLEGAAVVSGDSGNGGLGFSGDDGKCLVL